jgi:hypothetical protein
VDNLEDSLEELVDSREVQEGSQEVLGELDLQVKQVDLVSMKLID